MQPIDLSTALSATDGDVDLLREVIGSFLDEYPKLLIELANAIELGDFARVRRASHTIKGTLRIFGDLSAREIAGELEEMGKTECLTLADAKCKSLKLSLAALHQQLADKLRGGLV